MSQVDVKLKLGVGTLDEPPAANPAGWSTWKQGYKAGNDGKYTVKSVYWYSYQHQKDNGNAQAGGEVDLPAGGTFTVGPQGSEVITDVKLHETVPGATDQTYYAVTPPVAPAKIWSVADTEHEDPNPENPDTFDVYARDKADDPIVKCDPIIRNKNSG